MNSLLDGAFMASAIGDFLREATPGRVATQGWTTLLGTMPEPRRIFCLGKAAPALARTASLLWPGVPGLLYGTSTDGETPPSFQALRGDHPFPTPHNEAMTFRVERWIEDGEGPLLACISGGGSSLLVHPRPPWTLDEQVALTAEMWRRGVPIRDLNSVRSRLSEVKGGGLLRLVGPWPVATALWSDVGYRDARWVSSGPSLPVDAGGRAEEVLAQCGIVPPKPLPPRRQPAKRPPGDTMILLFDAVALRRLCVRWFREEGHRVREVPCAEGQSARTAAIRLAKEAAGGRSLVLVGTGEVRVDATAGGGKGGRCSHLAAEVALALGGAGSPRPWSFAALATDGVDGTAGGGAWTDSSRCPSEASLRHAVDACDTGTLWEKAGTLLPRRPTGNNLRDLWVLVMGP